MSPLTYPEVGATRDGRAQPSVTVTCSLGLGPLRLTAPCQVVWTVIDERRAGFGYGTLPGHPARGEEAFVVERADDQRVWLVITAFSLPARWYMRAAGPGAGLLQRAFARRCGQVLKNCAHSRAGRSTQPRSPPEMSAYVIVEIEVDDPVGYEEYRSLATASVARYGGRYVARGGQTEAFEGEWLGRIVILEFDSLEAAQAWYHSDDYQQALLIRRRTSRGRMIAVEGTGGA